MVRPCGARGFGRSGRCGLASMYPVFDWGAKWPPTIMDISTRASSLADRPQAGHSGHQCSHASGRPILHLVSSSRRPRRVQIVRYDHRSLLMSVVPLFVLKDRSFVPTCGCRRAARKSPSRLAVAQALRLASALPGHALTGSSTARDLSGLGCRRVCLDPFKLAPLV